MEFSPGTILLFRGSNWTSRLIALGSNLPSQWFSGCAPSHCGIVAHYEGRNLLFESTSLCTLPCEVTGKRVKGVQAHRPSTRIEAYAGHVWAMKPIDPALLAKWQDERLSSFCRLHLGEGYDFDHLLVSGTLLRKLWFIRPPKRLTICSRFVAAALRDIRYIGRDIAPSEWTPAMIARLLPHRELYSYPEMVK